MTTLTATAPTEHEIREALDRRVTSHPHDDPRLDLRHAIVDWATPLTSPSYDALESPDSREPEARGIGELDTVWVDLRPSEAIVLRDLARDPIERAYERCRAIIVEELVSAGLAFAEEYPDAPRAVNDPA